MRAQHSAADQRPDSRIPPEPRPPRSFAGLYLATWALLATLAVGYIAVLLLQPQWAAPLTTQSLRTAPKPEVSPEVQQISAEVGSLRRTVADLQRELSYVKSTAALQQETIASLRPASPDPELAGLEPELPIQIAAVEGQPDGRLAKQGNTDAARAKARLEDSAQVQASEADAPRAKAIKTPAPTAKTSPSEATAATPERSQRAERPAERNAEKNKVVVLNAQPTERPEQPEPLETGSLPPAQPPTITFGPAIVTPAPQPVAIHLDAGPSIDALRLRWSMLHNRHPSALRELEPRYLIAGTAASPSYQLTAGPVSSPDEASRICALLRAKRVPCSVGGPFIGQPH